MIFSKYVQKHCVLGFCTYLQSSFAQLPSSIREEGAALSVIGPFCRFTELFSTFTELFCAAAVADKGGRGCCEIRPRRRHILVSISRALLYMYRVLWRNTGLFCVVTGFLCVFGELFCRNIGLFCGSYRCGAKYDCVAVTHSHMKGLFLRVLRALLRMCRALLRMCRALLRMCRALFANT